MTNIDNHGISVLRKFDNCDFHYHGIMVISIYCTTLVYSHSYCILQWSIQNADFQRPMFYQLSYWSSATTDWAPEFTAYLNALIEQKLLVLLQQHMYIESVSIT